VLEVCKGLQDVSQEEQSSQNRASRHAASIHELHLILADFRVSFGEATQNFAKLLTYFVDEISCFD